jgi:NitT/TauT family transport system substrate-binding protein
MNHNTACLPTVSFLFTLGFSVLLTSGCSRDEPSTAAESDNAVLERIIVQLDWVAEPEHGGFYQAQALGYFEEEKLNVELIQGGANAFVHQKIATGQAQFGQSDSTNALLAIAEGLPLINIAAVFQHDPSVLIVHSDNPITSFEELAGKTIMARPEWVFLAFLRKKYEIEINVIPQNFGLAQFIADPGFIQQGFYIAEPYFIEKAGVIPRYLYTWEAGFDAYTVIIGNREFVERHPNATKAFLRAYIRGYQSYLNEDPTPAHQMMLEINPKVTSEYLDYSRAMILSEHLATGLDGGSEMIGRISRDRFATQISQLEELDILEDGDVSVDDVMTDRYLP